MPAPSLLQLLGRPVMCSGAAASHSLDVWYFLLRAHRGTHRSRMFSVCFWRQRGSTQQPLSRGAPSTWDSEEEAPTACSPGVNGERKARCQMSGVASTTGVQGKALRQSLPGPRWVGSECLESALLSGRCACWVPAVLMPMVLSQLHQGLDVDATRLQSLLNQELLSGMVIPRTFCSQPDPTIPLPPQTSISSLPVLSPGPAGDTFSLDECRSIVALMDVSFAIQSLCILRASPGA